MLLRTVVWWLRRVDTRRTRLGVVVGALGALGMTMCSSNGTKTSAGVTSGTGGSTTSAAGSTGGTTTGTGGLGPGFTETLGPWTAYSLPNAPNVACDAFNGATISAIWFSSTTNGDIATQLCRPADAIYHLDGPTHADAVALSGYHALPGAQNDFYYGFFTTPAGLIASGYGCGNCASGDVSLILSTDMGKTFTYSKFDGTQTPTQPSTVAIGAQALWISADSSGGTIVYKASQATSADGALWTSPTAPGATATFTDVFQPGPQSACDQAPWAGVTEGTLTAQTNVFWASPDGKTMVYAVGSDVPLGVCRSTDGGRTFAPIAFPNAPSAKVAAPSVILGYDATNLVAVGNGGPGHPALFYSSSDAGATWTAASSLPAGAQNAIVVTNGFLSADGSTAWVTGVQTGTGMYASLGTEAALLYKSTDKGHTWTDVSAALMDAQLRLGPLVQPGADGSVDIVTGFALDADNIWLAVNTMQVLYSSTGGQ
jgi:hypothetical protein